MGFTVVAPRTVEEAIGLLEAQPPGERAILAGGTDLLSGLEGGRAGPSLVVSLRNLPWRTHAWEKGALVVGSTLPLSELESDPRLRRSLPGLWEAVHAVGGIALRHRATMGGNLGRSSPASDLLPVLLALDARVRIIGGHGRREVPLESFVLGSRSTTLQADELIEAVAIPSPAPSAYLWQRVRPANDISQVGVAVAFAPTPPHWRIALGGVSPRPLRIVPAEALLPSPTPSDFEMELAAQAAAEHAPFITDKRATESYRRRLVTVLVRRAIRETIARRDDAAARGGAG